MPRKARILVSNCPHHIVQRGHNRKAVFLADEDYAYYLDNLREWKQRLGIKLYAWCLMTNHIHVIAEPADDAMTLSELMKRANGRQAAYVNRLEGRSGALWEGRYKASPIQQDSYLLSCCRYVELNPVRAGMVENPGDYRWSSYRERMYGNGETMMDEDICYQGLGKSSEERRMTYRHFLDQAIPESEKKLIKNAVSRNQLTGNQPFIDEIEMRTGLRIEKRGRGRPPNEIK